MTFFFLSEYMHSGVHKRRDPKTMPSAPIASSPAICLPVETPPAASIAGPDGNASRTAAKSKESVGASPFPCPPASCPVNDRYSISISLSLIFEAEPTLNYKNICVPFVSCFEGFSNGADNHKYESFILMLQIPLVDLINMFSQVSPEGKPDCGRLFTKNCRNARVL
jgi:hypothetical protein